MNAAQGGRTRQPFKKADIKAADYPFKDKKRYHCGVTGHIARDCDKLEEKDRGMINAQFGYTLLQKNKKSLRPNYLYLDTCTTNNFMCNQAYLTGVHVAERTLHLQTNAGSTSTDE